MANTMHLLLEQTHSMTATGDNEQAACHIRIYAGIGTAEGKTIILATDDGSNSVVTNQVEQIATDAVKNLKLDPNKVVFIEHRRASASFEETFDLVHLQWQEPNEKFTKPNWSAFTRKAVEKITGETKF